MLILLSSLFVAVSARFIAHGFWRFSPDGSPEDERRAGLADATVDAMPIARWDPAERKEPWRSMALEMPKGPLKGQKRAPCRPKGEVEISRACWVQVGTVSPPCGGDWYEWKGFCYVPVLAPERPSTSDGP